jgi:hypothetical protein
MAQLSMVTTPAGDYLAMVHDIETLKKSLIPGSDVIPLIAANTLRLHTIYGQETLVRMLQEFNKEDV